MSGSRRRIFASRTITLVAITLFLIVVGLICTLFTFPRALAAPIVSDDFNDNSIDTAKWNPNDLFSGFTNTNVPIAEISQRLEIGPLLQNVNGSSYRGMRTVNTYNFSGAYSFVELVQAPASNTAADAMFTIGNDVNNYYRIYVSAGNLIGLKKIAGTKTTLFTIAYNSTNHRFLRIRNNSGNVTLDTAPGSGGVPGTWTQQYTETWNTSISTAAIMFEVKGGTSQVEANAPGKVIFDNFEVASNTAPAPTVIGISPTSGSTNGGTSVTITGTGFSAGATVSLGGTSATNVTVVSSTSITATTPAHAAGTVNVVVTNTDSQSGTLTNGYTYSAGAPAPTVTAISPTSGTTSGGTSVTITGTGFSTGATVSLGGTAATNVTVVSSTSITATTPAHAAGTVNVVVTNTDSQSGTLTSGYTYSSSPLVSLKMVTANLQHGMSTDGTFHYDQQANNITSTSDLVAAQEVSEGDIPNWDAAFTAGGFHKVIFREHYLSLGDGNAIWARNTLTEIQTYEHDLANGVNPASGSSIYGYDGFTDIRRSVVAAKFSVNSKQFYVVSVHLCPSRCRDASAGTFESVQRVTQIQDLLSWIDSTLTGGLPVYILGDLNLTTDTPKQPSGFQFDLFTQAGFSDQWQTGLSNGLAEANWGDRDVDSIPDMPLGTNTRTADTRRIDYILYKPNNGSISLVKISVPDGRAQCPQALVNDGGSYLACPAVSADNPKQRWDIPEDQGVRLSDHNWIWIELGF